MYMFIKLSLKLVFYARAVQGSHVYLFTAQLSSVGFVLKPGYKQSGVNTEHKLDSNLMAKLHCAFS